MRARKRKNTPDRIVACSEYFIEDPLAYKSNWNEAFGNNQNIRLEIGCGKGDFVKGMAEKNPDVNFIAIEKATDIIVLALEKIKDAGLKNVRFINCDAELLTEIFPEGMFDTIYINFCDPWPKKRHAKRRLTSPIFLELFKKILSKDGEIHFKTDNRPLFDYSLETFPECGYKLKNISFDLHTDELPYDNVKTEYERNFIAKGFKINRLEAFIEQEESQ
ncbi:MAG: tRNA (guanosine(46)-N7)-methyltransferase TrmB [Ruminococcaceae bacterium]|nr:tRNA (guanosine(46)-N7)-methyltransferase TrmB [Oscillospiraceae bacterium]